MPDETSQDTKKLPAVPPPTTRSGAAVRPLVPTNVDECWQMAKYFSTSGVIPSSYPGKKGDHEQIAAVFGAIQMGASVGLPPIQAVANIMVVNGKFAMYGDGQLSVVRNSGELEYIREFFEGDEPTDGSLNFPAGFKAVCVVKRRGEDEQREEYTVGDAKRAGLWGSKDPWKKHPKRMLKYRARAFALRDHFGDCLLGLQHSAEELVDAGDLYEQPDGTYSTARPAMQASSVSAADIQAQAAGDTEGAQEGEDGDAGAEGQDEATFTLTDAYGQLSDTFTDPEKYADALLQMIVACGIAPQLEALREHNENEISKIGSARESATVQEIWRAYNAKRRELSAHQQEADPPAGGDDAAAPGAGPAGDGGLI